MYPCIHTKTHTYKQITTRTTANCLRSKAYIHKGAAFKGYNLESILMHGGVDAYFSGHEHRMQHHHAQQLHHFVCGASGAEPSSFYQGPNHDAHIDWVDNGTQPLGNYGFAAARLAEDSMVVKFVTQSSEVIKEVHIPRRAA